MIWLLRGWLMFMLGVASYSLLFDLESWTARKLILFTATILLGLWTDRHLTGEVPDARHDPDTTMPVDELPDDHL